MGRETTDQWRSCPPARRGRARSGARHVQYGRDGGALSVGARLLTHEEFMLIRIELPRNRDFCGRLLVLGDAGKIAFGPEWWAGRANDAAAFRRGNDSRSCLLPYGDTPLGHYRLRRFISIRR